MHGLPGQGLDVPKRCKRVAVRRLLNGAKRNHDASQGGKRPGIKREVYPLEVTNFGVVTVLLRIEDQWIEFGLFRSDATYSYTRTQLLIDAFQSYQDRLCHL